MSSRTARGKRNGRERPGTAGRRGGGLLAFLRALRDDVGGQRQPAGARAGGGGGGSAAARARTGGQRGGAGFEEFREQRPDLFTNDDDPELDEDSRGRRRPRRGTGVDAEAGMDGQEQAGGETR